MMKIKHVDKSLNINSRDYDVGESCLKRAPKGKLIFMYLCEDNFNVIH